MKRLNIGIDVSKETLDICIYKSEKDAKHISILNKENSIKDFLEFLKENYGDYEYYFGYEATSNYMRKLQHILDSNNYKNIMINSYALHHYFKYIGIKEKTDKVDSYGIARYISEKSEDDFINEIDYKLKNKYQNYVTLIEMLSKMKVQVGNLKESQDDVVDEEIIDKLKEIEEELNKIKENLKKKAIKKLKKDIPEYKELIKIAGAGEYTLLVILPIIASAKNKTFKQIQAYFGLNPIQYQSGSSIYKRPKISKRGNSIARKVLYMGAMSARKYNKIIKEKYERLLKNGKKKRVALTACMVHLLKAIYSNYHKLSIR